MYRKMYWNITQNAMSAALRATDMALLGGIPMHFPIHFPSFVLYICVRITVPICYRPH